MIEADIQNYLFENPDYLFPEQNIQEKAKEYSIKGKRIDLLFRVGGIRFIVEVKNTAIKREHIGQLVEYYGLMKEYLSEANLKMILVAPVIEKWQKIYLEELGIRCVEFDKVLSEKNFSVTETQKGALAFNEIHWLVFLDRIDPELDTIRDRKTDSLKHLCQFEDSYINLFSFRLSSKRSFVSKAKLNDYVLQVSHDIGKITVIPFRRIIKIDENRIDRLFFLEARESERINYLSYNSFKDRLLKINSNLNVGDKSVRKLKADEIFAIKSVFKQD